VGLKSKMYSYILDENGKVKNNKTAKGVNKDVIKSEIKHSDSLNVLLNEVTMHHQMLSIRSELHQISSYHLNEVSLSPFDDKRYILDDGISSYSYGHYLVGKGPHAPQCKKK